MQASGFFRREVCHRVSFWCIPLLAKPEAVNGQLVTAPMPCCQLLFGCTQRYAQVASLYAGCDVVQHVMRNSAAVLLDLYGISVIFESVWLCESNENKIAFLTNQHKPRAIFTEAAQVKELMAHDAITDDTVPVPYCDLVFAGFPCTSKTSLSAKSTDNKRCIREGTLWAVFGSADK
jgi:hypothetical protein